MNICMVGYGMMGVWHSDALQGGDVRLHTLVGRRPEATREFAEHYFRRWDDARHESLATRALARASADVRAMSNALLLGGVRDVSRRDAALRAMWTRWIAYVSLSELAPRLCGDLVRHDCAIVAWKHWVYATKDALAR